MKKFVAFLLSILMVAGQFGWFTAKAESNVDDIVKEISVYIDVQYLTKEDPKPFFQRRDYKKVLDIGNRGLDEAVHRIESLLGKVKIIDREAFLDPVLVLELSLDQQEALQNEPYVREMDERIHFSALRYHKRMERMNFSGKIIGLDRLPEGIDGRGQVVAVLDNYFNPDHEVFYLSSGVKGKLDQEAIATFLENKSVYIEDNEHPYGRPAKAEELYYNEKIPFAASTLERTLNLNTQEDPNPHGQHVAGTAAGNVANVRGERWQGVAPNAQLVLAGIFRGDATNDTTVQKVVGWAIQLGAASVNLSIGELKESTSRYDKWKKKLVEQINMAFQSGTNVCVAAGNFGEYQGDLSVEHPDYGTISHPGIIENAITVASLENNSYTANYFIVSSGSEEQKFIYLNGNEYEFTEAVYDIVDCGLGREDEMENLDLGGKVALFKRGDLSFKEKFDRAQEKGAIGILLYNNAPGELVIAPVDGITIPVGCMLQEDGERLKKQMPIQGQFKAEPEVFLNPLWGQMSPFSDWGLTADGVMKPDITAPGGHIYSAANGRDMYGDMSGTSMATPHVSGAVAVVRQVIDDPTGIFRDVLLEEKAALVKALLMNAAIPHLDPADKTFTSPRKQGAGILDVAKAADLDYTIVHNKTGRPSAFIGDIEEEINFTVRITNYADHTQRLQPSFNANIEKKEGDFLTRKTQPLFSKNLDVIEVGPKESVEYEVRIPLENHEILEEYRNGAFVEGYLSFINQDGKQASFPYVAFKGEFGELPIMEKPIYEFDFSKERPMYWTLGAYNNAWHNFSTHIETEVDGVKKVLGMINFDEIDEARKNGIDPVELIPRFAPKLVISPNSDGKADSAQFFGVYTRSSNTRFYLELPDGTRQEQIAYKGFRFKNISHNPDMNPNVGISKPYEVLGYYDYGYTPFLNRPEGLYKFIIEGTAVSAGSKEKTVEIPFYLDLTPPTLEVLGYLEPGKVLVKAEDNVLLRDAYVVKDGEEAKLSPWNDNVYIYEEGKDGLEEVIFKAEDEGYLTTEQNALEAMEDANKGVLVVKSTGLDIEEVHYHIEDDQNQIITPEGGCLPYGTYRFVIDDLPADFETPKMTFDFELNRQHAGKEIILQIYKKGQGMLHVQMGEPTEVPFELQVGDLRWTENDFSNGELKTYLPFGMYTILVHVGSGYEGISVPQKIGLSEEHRDENVFIYIKKKTPVLPETPTQPVKPKDPYIPYLPKPTAKEESNKEGTNQNSIQNEEIEKQPKFQISEPVGNVSFEDISDDKNKEAILELANRGILKGTGEKKFEPNTYISRAMVVEILRRISRDKDILFLQSPFKDVQEGEWYYDAVYWASSRAFVLGDGEGWFKPNDLVSRQEFAVILQRYVRFQNIALNKTQEFSYKDENTIAEWGLDAVKEMDQWGLVRGEKDDLYGPESKITRSELAAIIYRLIHSEL
ncbi:MAG: S8 family serine peptidase [Tissierellia bacterium]|nr:S8 family serine peptidase [Tissierellia bacterium]